MTDYNPYTAQQVTEVALALTKGAFRLASVVRRFGPNDFKEGRGDTVYLNVPGALTAYSRALDDVTHSIVLDSLTEAQEPVKLDVHAYSAVGLSEHDLTLGLQDFAKQVLVPQVDSVIDRIESSIETVLACITEDATIAYSAANPVALFTAGRRALRTKGIDVAEARLVALVGASVVDDLFASGALDFDKTGSADALRNGSLGRIRGFETLESGRVGDDEVVFMTKDALYLAHRAPIVPQGASFGQTVIGEGLSLRYLRDYDVTKTQDRSLVSTFVGAGVLPLYKVERTQDTGKQGDGGYAAGSATVTEVTGGAVAKVNTATNPA
jgi:hypothetical protein